MTVPNFDDLIHPRQHLRLCAMLTTTTEIEFTTLRQAMGVSDPSLSKYLKALSAAGYVEVTKPVSAGRRRTWARLTSTGRTAFLGHLAEIQRLADTAGVLDHSGASGSRSQPELGGTAKLIDGAGTS